MDTICNKKKSCDVREKSYTNPLMSAKYKAFEFKKKTYFVATGLFIKIMYDHGLMHIFFHDNTQNAVCTGLLFEKGVGPGDGSRPENAS